MDEIYTTHRKNRDPEWMRKRFFGLKIAEKSIHRSLSFCLNKYYLSKNQILRPYSERILTISLFLFITSSFLYRKRNQKFHNFSWKSYIQIFSKNNMTDFLQCSILYLYEHNHFSEEDKRELQKDLPKIVPTFRETYLFSIIKKNTSDNDLSLMGISLESYINLISISLRLFEIIRYEISLNPSKVIELISLTDFWKEKITQMFSFKSEYITFLYFVNLRRRNGKYLIESFKNFLHF